MFTQLTAKYDYEILDDDPILYEKDGSFEPIYLDGCFVMSDLTLDNLVEKDSTIELNTISKEHFMEIAPLMISAIRDPKIAGEVGVDVSGVEKVFLAKTEMALIASRNAHTGDYIYLLAEVL